MLDDLKRALRIESPTPRLSETNLKKLSRGLRSSKKSLHSVHSALETSSVPDGHLGGRSVSLSTLVPSGGGMRPRVNKLQTLEAKMASIEVSLGWRRRREALLETLPRAARDLVRELDGLHQALREKDTMIQTLKTQITNLGGSVGGGGGEGGVGGGNNGGSLATEGERRTITERLARVQQEMDAKRVAVKNLKLTLDKIDITDNIDVRIRAAELEYELEREELNILNLKEESTILTARLQDPPPSSTTTSTSTVPPTTLHALLSSSGGAAALGGASLISLSLTHNTPSNPPFHVTPRPPQGCVIDWATDDTKLKKGDRLVEVNGESVVGRSLEQVTRAMGLTMQLTLVVARPFTVGGGGRRGERPGEVKELVGRLDRALREKDTLKSDNTRLNHRIGYLEDQVAELQSSLSRSCHPPTSTLTRTHPDTIVTTSQPGATVIQVFQKGDQKLAVASPEMGGVERAHQYPTLPRVRSPDSASASSLSSPTSSSSSSRSSSDRLDRSRSADPRERNPSSSRQHDPLDRPPSSRPASCMAEHRRSVISPRPESKNEDCRPSSRTKPVPPKKPERLSLQRTTSQQSVDEGLTHNSTTTPSRTLASPTPTSPTSPVSRIPHHQTWQDSDIQSYNNQRGLENGHDINQERTLDKKYERANNRSYDRSCERGSERTSERSHERENGRSYDRNHEKNREKQDYHSTENIYERPVRNHYGSYSGDGSVRMIIGGNHAPTETLSRRPSPQGAATPSTTTEYPQPNHYSYHNPHSHQNSYRCRSPDAAFHLDSRDDLDNYQEELYSHVGVTGRYSSHHHTTTTTTTSAHHRYPHQTHNHHYSPHTPPVPASRNNGHLSVATSPRAHEQWC